MLNLRADHPRHDLVFRKLVTCVKFSVPRTASIFALATLIPVPFLILGVGSGGWALGAATLYIGLLVAVLDFARAPDKHSATTSNGLAFKALSVVLAVVQFAALYVTIWALSGAGDIAFASPAGLLIVWIVGLFIGQVGNSNAHELIHQPKGSERFLGRWLFISILFGHHASAHPGVHHRHVATPHDPNSSELGESFYRFLPRAWIGSHQSGLALEKARLRSIGMPAWHWSNPYWTYTLGTMMALGLSAYLGGVTGILVHMSIAIWAQAQLLLSDYVQHYGLKRMKRPNGRYEPVGDQHSWNAPHWFSSLWMLNAPFHSDHHAHPNRPYPILRSASAAHAPQLPYGLPVMAAIALAPTLWRRVMDHRVRQWQKQRPRGQD